jgi:hypothetical protein
MAQSDATRYEEELTFCEVHPDRETSLRCNRCNRLMCAQCAVPTPVGYRCRQCVRQIENTFFTGTQGDYLIAGGVAAVLTTIVSVIALQLPLLFIFFFGLPLGGAIGEAVLRATGKRRTRYRGEVSAAGAVIGGLLGGLITATLAYESFYQDIRRAVGAMGEMSETLREQLVITGALPASRTEWIIQYMTSDIGLLLFVAVVTFAIYTRLKL